MSKSDARTSKRTRLHFATITDDEEWTDGNFEVITSDRVRFKVPDYLLFWARLVVTSPTR